MVCFASGEKRPIDWRFRELYKEEYTTEPLPDAHIREAIIDELSYFNDNVWLDVSAADAHSDPEGKVLSGRVVMCSKGDLAQPDVRARYVACELNTFDDTSFFAATPPLEAKRLLMSQWACERVGESVYE